MVRNKNIAALLLCLLFAVPAIAGNLFEKREFKFTQPDGVVFTALVTGDHYYKTVASKDGYTLIEDAQSGFWCYAQLSDDGESLISTGVKYSASQKLSVELEKGISISDSAKQHISAENLSLRDFTPTPAIKKEKLEMYSMRSFSTDSFSQSFTEPEVEPIVDAFFPEASGNKKVLVLLAYFPYEEGVYDPNEYQYLELPDFESDYDPRTALRVSDFFNDSSYSGEPNWEDPNDQTNTNYWGFKGSVHEYFADVSDAKLNLTATVSGYHEATHPITYYENQSGSGAQVLIQEMVTKSGVSLDSYDSIVCYYAGASTSFSDIVSNWWTGTSFTDSSGSMTKNCMILEMDFYYFPGIVEKWLGRTTLGWNLPYYNAGEICLMGTGFSPYPVKPAAPYRVLSGWIDPTAIVNGSNTAGIDGILKYKNPDDSNKYFLIENRFGENSSDWDSGLAGLSIWNVDEEYYGGAFAMARLVPSFYGGHYHYFYSAPNATELTPTTMPDSRWLNYNHSDVEITEVSEVGSAMSFNFNVSGPPNADTDTIWLWDTSEASLLESSYKSISSAIADANNSDIIYLAKGHTYIGNIAISTSNITIRSYDPDLPEGERFSVAQPYYPEDTILQGYYPESVITMINNDSTIAGVTITGGLARDNLDPQFEYGGGVRIGTPFEIDYVENGGSPILKECIIKDNYAFKSGGGVYSSNSRLTIENCQIFDNEAETGSGGGVFASYREHSNPNDVRDDSIVIKGSIIDHNLAYWGGGIASDYGNRAEIINCTIANNQATQEGGGIDCQDGTAFVVNTIVWGNTADLDPNNLQVTLRANELLPEIYFHYSYVEGLDKLKENYSDIFVNGRSNLPVNSSNSPLFANPAKRNYHLMSKDGRWIGEGDDVAKYDLYSEPNDIINNYDFGVFASSWKLSDGELKFLVAADFDFSGTVDFGDFVLFADNYLTHFDDGDFVYDTVTSPCINAGDIDPRYSYADEVMENGYRINMGAYGGTNQASKSPDYNEEYTLLADIDGDDDVDADDYNLFYDFYVLHNGKFNPSVDYDGENGVGDAADAAYFKKFDFDNNGWLDMDDYLYFMNSWNWSPPWLP